MNVPKERGPLGVGVGVPVSHTGVGVGVVDCATLAVTRVNAKMRNRSFIEELPVFRAFFTYNGGKLRRNATDRDRERGLLSMRAVWANTKLVRLRQLLFAFMGNAGWF